MKRILLAFALMIFLAQGAWSQTRSTLPGARPGKRVEVVQDTAIKDTVKPASSLADWATTWLRFGSRTDTAYAKTASLQVGFNFYLAKNTIFPTLPKGEGDTVKNMGLAVALGVPVRIPYVVAWANVKLFAHGVSFVSLKNPGSFFTIADELNVGKNFVLLGQPIEYIPHLGIGFDNSITVGPASNTDNATKGYQTHYFMHMNLGLIARKSIEIYGLNTNVGITLNFEFAIVNGKGEETANRLNVSLIGSY